jgi:hypothetical protein
MLKVLKLRSVRLVLRVLCNPHRAKLIAMIVCWGNSSVRKVKQCASSAMLDTLLMPLR